MLKLKRIVLSNKHPFVVKILIILYSCLGLSCLAFSLYGVFLFFEFQKYTSPHHWYGSDLRKGLAILIFVFFFSIFFAFITVVFGLVKLEKSAWFFTVVIQVVELKIITPTLFSHTPVIYFIIHTLIAGLILYELNRSKVKRAFGFYPD